MSVVKWLVDHRYGCWRHVPENSKISTHKHCRNLAMVGSQLIFRKSSIPIWPLFPSFRQNLMHITEMLCWTNTLLFTVTACRVTRNLDFQSASVSQNCGQTGRDLSALQDACQGQTLFQTQLYFLLCTHNFPISVFIIAKSLWYIIFLVCNDVLKNLTQ